MNTEMIVNDRKWMLIYFLSDICISKYNILDEIPISLTLCIHQWKGHAKEIRIETHFLLFIEAQILRGLSDKGLMSHTS